MFLTKEMLAVLNDNTAHYFLKEIIANGVKRDPVDVLNDLEKAYRLWLPILKVEVHDITDAKVLDILKIKEEKE